MRKTKIVCTLGPATESEEVLEGMLKAGMNVARVNFSHGTHESQGAMIDKFRKVRDRLGIPAAVLLDTKGPEIRLRNFEGGEAFLVKGEKFTLTTEEILGNKDICAISYKNLPKELKADDTVLIDDGKLTLKVLSTTDTEIVTEVVYGGKVSNHKGINVPAVKLQMEYISDVDKSDLLFGIEKEVDFVAASFVRRADDVKQLRKLLDDNGGQFIRIISKIENVEGIENFEEILAVSDGIMVARGDMGVEVDFERLPAIQKRFIKRCDQSGKVAITATQMLESMIQNPRPTRAEITDVANAVYDGTTAVMLSGESASGKFPVESVKAMAKIAEQAEKDDPRFVQTGHAWYEMNSEDITNAVGHATSTMARDIHAKAIVAITTGGFTAVRMSKFRPQTGIIACTPSKKVYHQLCMLWGVTPVMIDNEKDLETLVKHTVSRIKEEGLVEKGDKLVISAGVPVGVSGNTNMIRVEVVE